jgi:hypothetical protein
MSFTICGELERAVEEMTRIIRDFSEPHPRDSPEALMILVYRDPESNHKFVLKFQILWNIPESYKMKNKASDFMKIFRELWHSAN